MKINFFPQSITIANKPSLRLHPQTRGLKCDVFERSKDINAAPAFKGVGGPSKERMFKFEDRKAARDAGAEFETTVFNRETNSSEPVTIKLLEVEDETIETYHMLNKEGEKIGSLYLHVFIPEKTHGEGIRKTGLIPSLVYYAQGENEGDINLKRLYVDDIKGSKSHKGGKYRGVGQKLMQLAYERSVEEGCEGRISLHAVGSPYPFYKKLNFKLSSKEAELVAEENVKNDEHPFEAEYMYLTNEGIENFKKLTERERIIK